MHVSGQRNKLVLPNRSIPLLRGIIMIRHGYVYLMDISLRLAWFPKSQLTDAQWIHAEWPILNEWNIEQFELTGEWNERLPNCRAARICPCCIYCFLLTRNCGLSIRHSYVLGTLLKLLIPLTGGRSIMFSFEILAGIALIIMATGVTFYLVYTAITKTWPTTVVNNNYNDWKE